MLVRITKSTAAVAMAAALSACLGTPIAAPSLPRGGAFALDPTVVRAALVHSEALALPARSTTLAVTLKDGAGNVVEAQDFTLAQTNAEREIASKPGTTVTVFALQEADRDRFIAVRDHAKRRKAARQKSSLAISISANPCLLGADSNAQSAAFYLKTNEKGFQKLADGLVLTGPGGAPVPPCSAEDAQAASRMPLNAT